MGLIAMRASKLKVLDGVEGLEGSRGGGGCRQSLMPSRSAEQGNTHRFHYLEEASSNC